MILAKPTYINSEARFKPIQPKEAQDKPHFTTLRYTHIRVETNEATSSASICGCNTSLDKPVSSCFRLKRRAESSVAASKNVLHFAIEAAEVE